MKFGLFYEWPNPGLRDWRRLFEEGIEQIQYAEELGYDFVLIAEHHFSNYGNSPAPLLQAMHIADRTRRIRIATAALVLPIWQPLRLAEEVAVLDNLSDGRFICGIGRGYQPHEFARFGVTPEESRTRFTECLDILKLAWTSTTSFTYAGDYFSVPHETVVWPKPRQQPYPPLWVAGTSPDTIKLAAAHDIAPITTGFLGPAGIRDTTALWVQERVALGRPIDTLELGIQAITHLADTDAEARDHLHYPRWQNRAGRALNRSDVRDGCVQPGPYEGEPDEERFFNSIYYGSPATIERKLRGLAAAGATFISQWMMIGGMEHEKVMRSIRLMGEEVLPALRDVTPPPDLYRELAANWTPPDHLEAAKAPSDIGAT
jgi:alkanesulfonate monooxygenase SsuD/methylene tetrahydromethanopterin reductase-like flavin-dependent oxidoreductase (luciferase family)